MSEYSEKPATTPTETRIDFIRHGEPVGGRMYRGNLVDHPLSKLGWQQMHAAIGKRYISLQADWDIVVSSPMLRCHAFADVLSKQLAIPLLINESLTEIGFGDWEGKTAEELKVADPALFHDFQRDPVNHRPPGAESLQGFSQRITDGVSALLAEYSGKKILLVTHAGIMRTLFVHVLSAPLKSRQLIRFPYAGMFRLYATPDQKRIEFL